MPPEIVALLHKPVLFIGVLAIGAFFGIASERITYRVRRWLRRLPKRAATPPRTNTKREPALRWQQARPQLPAPALPVRIADAADQLRIVMGADFTVQPLLNRSEARVYDELSRAVLARNPNWHVMAQVSLGEILRAKDADAYRAINSKRVDLLLMDGDYQPRHAIEYQGGAHYQGSAAARDAVKREALRRAGVGYHEVVAGFTTPSELRQLIEKLVDKPGALPNGAGRSPS